MIPSDLPAWKDKSIKMICIKIISLIRFDLFK